MPYFRRQLECSRAIDRNADSFLLDNRYDMRVRVFRTIPPGLQSQECAASRRPAQFACDLNSSVMKSPRIPLAKGLKATWDKRKEMFLLRRLKRSRVQVAVVVESINCDAKDCWRNAFSRRSVLGDFVANDVIFFVLSVEEST